MKNKNRNLFIIFGIVLLFLMLIVSCGDKKEAEEITRLKAEISQLKAELEKCKAELVESKKVAVAPKVYKLGLSIAITGPTSDAGNPYSKGVEDYFKFVNDTKILGGDKIDCTIRDDQYKTDITKRNFEEYLDNGIVMYLNYSTGSTLGLKRDFEEEQIAVLPASYHLGNLDDSNYIFLPIASYTEELLILAEYITKQHKGEKAKVALFVHPSAFGRGPALDVEKAVAAGLNVELVEVVEHGKDLDNTAMLKRLMSKKVQYVICQTVQTPVATMIKDAQRLKLSASSFGEAGKITFMGAHYTGGNDLIALAGIAAENFFWTTSFNITSVPGEGTTKQLALAKLFGRDEKAANSHNYAAGIYVAQVATETIKRTKAAGLEVNKENIYKTLNKMNGANAYHPYSAVGPVTYSKTDRTGVDMAQIYSVQNGVFKKVGEPMQSEYMKKIK